MSTKLAKVKHLKIDALPNIFDRDHGLIALTWFVLFAAASSACVYLICDAVAQFNEHKVTTTVRYLTEQEPATLPTITFCNINPFTSNYSLQLLAAANVSTSDDYWLQYLQVEAYMNASRGYHLANEEKLALSNFDQWIIPLKDVQPFSYERIFHPKYFGCLRFNANANMSTSSTGAFFHGLLYTGYAIPTLAQVNTPHTKGFYLFVQNATDDALGVDRNPILVTTGLSVQLSVSRKFYRQHPAPYSNCIEDKDSSQITRQSCLSLCAQVRTSEVCGCNSNRISFKVANFTDCSLGVELECAQDEVWNQIESLNAFCADKCPIECSQSVFDVSVNYGSLNLPEYDYLAVMGSVFWCFYTAIFDGEPEPDADLCMFFFSSSPPLDYFYKDVVQVTIAYETLAYVDSLEEPKLTGDDLLGIIGGHLSLFLGMSLLSLVECVELALLFVYHSLVGNERRTQAVEDTFLKPPPGDSYSLSNAKLGEIGERVHQLKMDALPNAVRSADSACLLVMWSLLLLAGAGVCTFLIVESIAQYAEYKVSATVTLQTSSDIGDLELPRITICNLHPFTTDYAFEYMHNITGYNILRMPYIQYSKYI